jgi:hypothetical protein
MKNRQGTMWKVQTYKVAAEPDALVFIYLLYGHLNIEEGFKTQIDDKLQSLGDQFADSAMIYSPFQKSEASIARELSDFSQNNKTPFDPTYQLGLLICSRPFFDLTPADSLHFIGFKQNDLSSFEEAVETIRRIASEQVNYAHAALTQEQKEAARETFVDRLFEAISVSVPLAPGVKLDVKKLVKMKSGS